MLLHRVLAAVESASAPVRLDDLSHELGIEAAALEGMLAFWARKGRLRRMTDNDGRETLVCSDGACSLTCNGIENCPFVARLPHSYAVVARPQRES